MEKSRALERSEGIRYLSLRLWMRLTIGNSRPTAKRPVRHWSSSSIIAGIRRISFSFWRQCRCRARKAGVNEHSQEDLLPLRIRRSGDDLSVCSQYGGHAARTFCPSRRLGRQGEYPLGRNDSISDHAESPGPA